MRQVVADDFMRYFGDRQRTFHLRAVTGLSRPFQRYFAVKDRDQPADNPVRIVSPSI